MHDHHTHHTHLWSLPDGTGLHAPWGELVTDPDTGHLACHLCGNWWVSLGSHVRAHGYTAETYREAMGLRVRVPLVASPLGNKIAERQRERYSTDEAAREALAVGQEEARSGRLAQRSRSANIGPAARPERRRLRREHLELGRRTQIALRSQELERRLAALGADDLGTFLRTRYAEGASLEDLARETGLGRDALQTAVRAAGVSVRKPGVNTATGKRSRAIRAEEEAAARVGTDDLRTWLIARRAEGWSLSALGEAVGHSYHWVSWRLAD